MFTKQPIKPTQNTKMFTPIKNMDTRCSTRCVHNWIQFGQKVPIGHYCECCIIK